ncbi:DUF1192 domain-containing protein [Telmatospirillum sp. J64-1]|uniref:DUF1192 domain-containing protein n=1 Tax=Telmatospirillum sp. J64-1 TaxID=2502183 RepID=UPI00115CE00F|nr:DUF1192 domain-containing protein [Telmatospirillum sp. J64-1]
MDPEDLEPRKQPAQPLGNLDSLSIAELEAHIVALEGEITRIRRAIAAKRNHRTGAEELFRKD